MIVLDLFAGTRSISRAFESRGHKAYSVEWCKDFENISLYEDINNLTPARILELCHARPNVIWASPDCTTYSIAGISHHRTQESNGNLAPVSDYAKFCDKTNTHLINLIKEIKPELYFIENPRGGMRKMSFMAGLPRYTVTYCQYGDVRRKPTDIWTNHPHPAFKPMCHNGDACHIPAPRGSKTGTQGLKTARDRSRIPDELCKHVVNICEEYLSGYGAIRPTFYYQKSLSDFFTLSQNNTIEDPPEKNGIVSVGYRSKKGNTNGGITKP